ncbi:MAG: thiosulfate sulfurtransferase, partial [Halieaceae bacterium]|nr:thiosulfate sulfurtransferase [Halieaceae bacterium]
MPYKQISIDDTKEFIDAGGVTVADIRDAGAYQAGS